jgi:hypothetical protein
MFLRSVFVEFIHASAAKLAHVQMDKKPFGDKSIIYVDFAKERKTQKTETQGTLSSEGERSRLARIR